MEYEKPAAHLEPHKARMWSLYLQHPDESPEWMGRHDLYLIHPPSRLASTAAWIAFRDKTVRPLMRMHRDDLNAANLLKQIEAILVWRATIPPEDHFWKIS